VRMACVSPPESDGHRGLGGDGYQQEPQGPARRRGARLTEMVPVRFPLETLEEVRPRAGDDDRSVSSWIRRAVEHELEQQTG